MEITSAEKAEKATWFSLISNALLALVKGLGGYFGNSYALIADAIESTTDIFSSFLVLLGIKYSSRPADENHPYGHGRAESLITFIVVGFLIASAAIIAYESIENIRTPHDPPQGWTLFILGAIIIWKEISFRLVMKRARETKSSSLAADAWHHRSDAITSVAAFIGISIAIVLGKGYEAADDWAALMSSGFILYNSYQIFRPALGEFMDESMHEDLVVEIRKIADTVSGIKGTEKCFVRKTGMTYHIELHAMVDGELSVKEGHKLAHRLEDALRKEIAGLGRIVVHIEPDRY